MYYGRDGDALMVLLGGGTKQRQNQDIQRVQFFWDEYIQEKRNAGKGT